MCQSLALSNRKIDQLKNGLITFVLLWGYANLLFLEPNLNSIGLELDILYHSLWMLNVCLWQIGTVDRLLERQPQMTEVRNKWSWELKIDPNAPFSYTDGYLSE